MSTVNGWLQSTAQVPVHKIDLSGSRGNGPFGGSHQYLGWILHVNVGNTSVAMFEAGPPSNPYLVTPTIQVYKSIADGGVVQFLPLDWQPWCQIDGNFHYGAAETAGFPDEPLTDFQLDALAYFEAESHTVMGAALAVADQPGQPGIGTHQMGGQSWGGHACPGTIRQNQRPEIIRRANALLNPEDIIMTITAAQQDDFNKLMDGYLATPTGKAHLHAAAFATFNVDHDKHAHAIGDWLYGVPGYKGPADRAAAAAAAKHEAKP